jgi:transposase
MDAVAEAHDGDIQMIDPAVVRLHHHTGNYLVLIKPGSIRLWLRTQ